MARLKATFIVITLFLSGFASAQLPDNPRPVADRSFWLVTSANGAATMADIITTSVLVGHTGACPYEVWAPQLYGSRPSAARTTLVMGALFAGSVGLSYELKKHNAHIWKLKMWTTPQAYLAYGHASGTIHNLQTCH